MRGERGGGGRGVIKNYDEGKKCVNKGVCVRTSEIIMKALHQGHIVQKVAQRTHTLTRSSQPLSAPR